MLSADFQFAQIDLELATLVLIRVLRTLINSIAKNFVWKKSFEEKKSPILAPSSSLPIDFSRVNLDEPGNGILLKEKLFSLF